MITAVLVDDEKAALEVLSWQLAEYCPQVTVLGTSNNAAEGVELIREKKPDLLFLDIEMPVQNGFGLLEAFEDPTFDVIFTTAYNQYAIKAFKFCAFDYLLKPIDAEDLKTSVNRYLAKQRSSIKEQLKELSQQLHQKQLNRIAVPSSDGLMMLRPEQIVRLESESNYTRIFFDNGKKTLVAKTLKELEDVLINYQFYRVHHSHLINLPHVQGYSRNDGGHVLMSDGSHIPVARTKKAGFIEQFSKL
jgi:two-component system LytT family response regulator